MSAEKYGRNTILVGPWGGQDGMHWDDGVHSTIRQLEILHGAGIDSIRIEYDDHGKSTWSEKHGGRGGAKTAHVRLEYPDEFLISFHGHYGSLQERGPVFVRSLTFESNKRTYGPYGIEQGTYFEFPPTHGKIVGFVGKSGWYLDAFGAYMHTPHKPIAEDSILDAQHIVSHGNERYKYSMIHGNINPSYDLIVAVRRKDGNNYPPPVDLSQENFHELRHAEHKNQGIASSVPRKNEELPPRNVKEVVKVGPWGGNGGNVFDDGIYDAIRQINLSRNVGLVSIQVCYQINGQPVWGSKNGGTGSFKKDKIILDYPSEILTHITGYHGPTMIMGPDVIKSLTFHTTRGKYGPYGEEQGQFFSTSLKDEGSTIIGFHGRTGMFMDAIGVHLIKGKVVTAAPICYNQDKTILSSTAINKNSASNNSPSNSNNQIALSTNKVDNSQRHLYSVKRGQTESVQRMVKDPAPFGTGPWGGDGGKPWDDGVFTGIKQIVLTMGDAISSIEIEYDRNGQSVWSVKHGGTNGHIANRVKLEYPNEVLTCITGYYGPISKHEVTKVIQSLTFHTSRRRYGPFGEELGTYFASGTTEGKVVGFHGRSSIYLDAIGVHMQHWLGNQRTKPSLMKILS